MPQTPRRSLLTARPRVTYGRSRSSLHDDHDHAELPKAVVDKKSPRRHTSMSASSPPEEQQKSLRASHELHEAGRGHRFHDEIEYLLEGIQEKERLQVRRTSCVELTRSLLNPDFAMHVLIYGHWPAIARVLIQSQDQIIMASLAVIMTILALKPEAYSSLCETENLLQFLLNGLDLEQDPFAMISKNRQDATSINTLKEAVQEAGIVRRGQRVLVSSVLLSLLASLSGNTAFDQAPKERLCINLVNEHILVKTLDLLIMDMAWLKQATESPMSLSDVVDLGRVNSILRVFECGSRASAVVPKVLSARPKFFQIVTQLLVLSRAHAFQGTDESDAATLMMHTIRLLVNVSHESEACCTILTQCNALPVLTANILQLHGHSRRQPSRLWPSKQGRSEDDTQDWYDILLLSVGLVINLLEKSSASRHEFLHSAIKLDCSGTGPCLHERCTCVKSNQALERIIKMYKTEAHTKVEGNVLAAYLAVLIIRIVEDEATGQERLVQEVGEDGLQDMQLLLENFGLLYKAMLETLEDQAVHSSKEDATALPSKKEDTNDDRIRQTYQSIRNTIQILRNIQCSRVRVG